jgi:hypothetical protein
MREKAGEISLCGNVREKRAKCGSPPPNAGWQLWINKHVKMMSNAKKTHFYAFTTIWIPI